MRERNATPALKSSIPRRARGRIVALHSAGRPARIEYVLRDAVVGCREFDPDGHVTFDCGLLNGRPHGMAYRLDTPGKLVSATPYRDGVEHGLARQWSDDGRLIGSYRMRDGTGV